MGRGVVVALAAVLAVAGCTGGDSSPGLPDWVPEKLVGLTILPADGAEPRLTAEDAISTARSWLGSRFIAIPEREPEAVAMRITGKVYGTRRPLRVGERLPTVKKRPVWLLAWRGILENEFDPPFALPFRDEPIDFVVFVDSQTGDILYHVFLSGPNRLS